MVVDARQFTVKYNELYPMFSSNKCVQACSDSYFTVGGVVRNYFGDVILFKQGKVVTSCLKTFLNSVYGELNATM